MRRRGVVWLSALALLFAASGSVRAAITPPWAAFACAAGGDPGAPFLDVDGDGCFGPGDVVLDPAVLAGSFDAAVDFAQPGAGLVVPPQVKRIEVPGDATWTVGGDVLLHDTKLVIAGAATLGVFAGGRIGLDQTVVRGGTDASLLLYPGDDTSLDGTIKLKSCRDCQQPAGDFAVVASFLTTQVTFIEHGTLVAAGNVDFQTNVVAGDVRIQATGFADLGANVGSVSAGRVRLLARYGAGILATQVTVDDLKIRADDVEFGQIDLGGGNLAIGRLVAKAGRAIECPAIAIIGPANDAAGPGSTMVADEINLYGDFDLERVDLTGTTIIVFGGPLELRNGVVTGRTEGALIGLNADSCDLTGTRFRRIEVTGLCTL
jgi:hypothetical protein